MGLIQGPVNLTRYRVLDSPPELTDEFLTERLKRNLFLDIENTPDEESMGWVEILDHLAVDFNPTSFHFGPVIAMGLRIDTRRLSAKTVKRYLTMAVAQYESRNEKPMSSDQRRELKSKIRNDLLIRTPVNTDVYEVCWFPKQEELWLTATGVKIRERLEEMWHHTFGLGLIMKIPFVLARDLCPANIPDEAIDLARPSALFGHWSDA
jgi:DNA recombination-dependent growth factor C